LRRQGKKQNKTKQKQGVHHQIVQRADERAGTNSFASFKQKVNPSRF